MNEEPLTDGAVKLLSQEFPFRLTCLDVTNLLGAGDTLIAQLIPHLEPDTGDPTVTLSTDGITEPHLIGLVTARNRLAQELVMITDVIKAVATQREEDPHHG